MTGKPSRGVYWDEGGSAAITAGASRSSERAAIHAQLGALEKRLAAMPKPGTHREWIAFFKLRAKVKGLRKQLEAPAQARLAV